MPEPPQIRVIAFKDGDTWVAQCLEYDIAAIAADLHNLHTRLVIAINAEREESINRHSEPFAGSFRR
jgi:hypothetical protein